MDADGKPMSTKELTAAVQHLIERDEARERREKRRRRKRVRRERQQNRQMMIQLASSVETIKRCIIGVVLVVALFFLLLVAVVWEIGNEAQRIKGEVQEIKGQAQTMVKEIEREANLIREKLQNPLRSIGGALGGRLDSRIGEALGIGDE